MTRLEAARRYLHLSPNYVASYLGIAVASYSSIESGKTIPTKEQLKTLEEVVLFTDLMDEYHEPTDEENILNFKKMMLDKRAKACYNKTMERGVIE